MKPRWPKTDIAGWPLPDRSRAIRRGMARNGTLAHYEALHDRPLVLPDGADPELGRLFGIAAPEVRSGDD